MTQDEMIQRPICRQNNRKKWMIVGEVNNFYNQA
jgi:hypothetical protein